MATTFEDIENHVMPNNFGVTNWKGNVNITNGIRLALEHGALTEKQLDDALAMFEAGNFGTAYAWDEKPQSQSEFGQYKTELTKDEAGYLWLHRESGTIIIYFHFER
ncbi:MAG: hypothetical protein HUK20_11765 [Fibrobacter sp.]|nr:hypothetical protein [Fibrobacter sp.]